MTNKGGAWNPCKLLIVFSQILLSFIFLWQVVSSLKRWSRENTLITFSQEYFTETEPPSITVCQTYPSPGDWHFKDDVDYPVEFQATQMSGDFVEVLQDHDYDWNRIAEGQNDLYQFMMTADPKDPQGMPCATFNPPGMIFANKQNQIAITINANKSNNVYIILHNKEQLLPHTSKFLGSSIITFPGIHRGIHKFYNYTFTMQKRHNLDLTSSPCNDKIRFTKCLTSYIERQLGCNLPFLSDGHLDRNCSGAQDEGLYWKESRKLSTLASHERGRITGCVPVCNFREFDHKQLEEYHTVGIYPNLAGFLTLRFFAEGSEMQVADQVLVYDGNNFLADCGGYLGLLLGYSVLSAIQNVATLDLSF